MRPPRARGADVLLRTARDPLQTALPRAKSGHGDAAEPQELRGFAKRRALESSTSLTPQEVGAIIPRLMRRQMCTQRFSDLVRLRDAATGLLPRHCRSRALPKLLAGRSRSTRDVSGQAPRGCGRGRPGLTANSALASIGARASQRGGASSRRSNVVMASTLLANWRRPLKPSEAGPIACGGGIGRALPTATKNQVGRSGGRWCAP
jgi:hypothetical protein